MSTFNRLPGTDSGWCGRSLFWGKWWLFIKEALSGTTHNVLCSPSTQNTRPRKKGGGENRIMICCKWNQIALDPIFLCVHSRSPSAAAAARPIQIIYSIRICQLGCGAYRLSGTNRNGNKFGRKLIAKTYIIDVINSPYYVSMLCRCK